MSEFLGSVFMIGIFFLAGITACYIENRKKEKRRKEEEMLNMQALYVLWMQEQALCEAAEQMAEERKNCTPSFKY
ncbi:hypothetical protein [Streptococcus sp. Marseille-P7375]|uniref:hypothetical protein n=1 Tax=Streptococcus sp. Marseille-P7375 TaxID=2487318 RepID=UPI0011E76437|nr:hypothetical protein [Streptococcus sp. Marseille-P7375]